MSNYKTVFFTLGVLQIILGLAMIIPVIIQFIYNELDSSFISSGIITIVFGILFFLSNLDHDKKLNLPQAFLLTALSWLSIAIFGSLPFVFSNLNLNITANQNFWLELLKISIDKLILVNYQYFNA